MIALVYAGKLEENALVGPYRPVRPGQMRGGRVCPGAKIRDAGRIISPVGIDAAGADISEFGNHVGLLYSQSQQFADTLMHGFDDLTIRACTRFLVGTLPSAAS